TGNCIRPIQRIKNTFKIRRRAYHWIRPRRIVNVKVYRSISSIDVSWNADGKVTRWDSYAIRLQEDLGTAYVELRIRRVLVGFVQGQKFWANQIVAPRKVARNINRQKPAILNERFSTPYKPVLIELIWF